MSTNDTTIPPRNTRAFAEYKAGVEWEANHGANIMIRWASHTGQYMSWSDKWKDTPFQWEDRDYRVAPAPPELHPIDQWRAMSPEEREGKVLEHHRDGGVGWATSREETDDYPLIRKGFTFRIRELTLAERNAAVRAKWEAMEETDDKAFRTQDGKRYRVEFLNRSLEGLGWLDNDDALRIPHPQFPSAWDDGSPLHTHVEYRLAPAPAPEPPKPRYVPWTAETCPVGAVVRNKRGERSVILCAVSDSSGWKAYATALGHKPFDVCLEEWTMDDGTPAGTLEQPQP